MKKEWNHYKPFEFIDLPYMKLLLNIWFVEGGRSVPHTRNFRYMVQSWNLDQWENLTKENRIWHFHFRHMINV